MDNIYWTQTQNQFWNFSFDEMGLIDFPTQIDYVLNFTGEQKLTYIGHSEGTIQAFLGLISLPEMASKLNLYVPLAPIAYVGHVKSLLLQAMAAFDADVLFEILGVQEFYLPQAISAFLPGICGDFPIVCDFSLYALVGPTNYMNNSRLSYYTHYEPNPTSVKNMVHWTQGVKTDTFEMFDYGKKGNEKQYGSATPPQYNLKLFPSTTVPTAFFCGGDDWLGDPKDVSALLNDIPPSPNTFVHMEATYGHLDPLIGYNAWQRIYPIILDLIAHYQPTSTSTKNK
jgi:pimeloyl-ACP methyl ester carboxylesterase